jgi:hypothetical protein
LIDFINKFIDFLRSDFTLDSNSSLKQIIEDMMTEKPQFFKVIDKLSKDSSKPKKDKSIENSIDRYYILSLKRFEMKEYQANLEKYDKIHLLKNQNPKILIEDLENDLRKSKKILNIDKRSKLFNDESYSNDDLLKLKKNNKLLELIVVKIKNNISCKELKTNI